MAASRNEQYEEAVDTRAKVNMLQVITIGVMLALAVGFVAVFISTVAIFYDAYTNKAATYLELTGEVRDINQKLDILMPKLEESINETNEIQKAQ